MTEHQAHHESMVRRVELSRKAIDPLRAGRSRASGVSRALGAVLEEAHERMDLAWTVLTGTRFDGAQHYTFRAQKAAELALCYATISKTYDELCYLKVIGRDEQTELTLDDMVKVHKEKERVDRANAPRPPRPRRRPKPETSPA